MKKEIFASSIKAEIRPLADRLFAAAEGVENAPDYVKSIMDSAQNIKSMHWYDKEFTWEMAVEKALRNMVERKKGEIGENFVKIAENYFA